MSLLRVAVFVVIEKRDEEEVIDGFNKLIDGFVINRLAILDSGLVSTEVEDVQDTDDIRREIP